MYARKKTTIYFVFIPRYGTNTAITGDTNKRIPDVKILSFAVRHKTFVLCSTHRGIEIAAYQDILGQKNVPRQNAMRKQITFL